MLKEVEIDVHEQTVIRILERCLPPGVLARWQDKLEGSTLPKLEELYQFIETTIFKLRSLERVALSGRNIAKRRESSL